MRSVNVAGLVAGLVSGVIALGGVPGPESGKMRAIVIHAYGGPEVMKLEEVARPEPAADEILIRVVSASINPVDVGIRKGYLAELVGNFPLIPGMDAAGIVEKVGNKVTKYKAGDPVFAFFTLKGEGGYAEFVTAKDDELAPKPSAVSFAQAAGAGAAGATAWEALIEQRICAGPDSVDSRRLRRRGSFSDPDCEGERRESFRNGINGQPGFLRQMGADVAIDYTRTKFEDVAKNVDVVLERLVEKRSNGLTAW